MRKALILLCVAGLMASMPPALAQEGRRDPFEPLIDENAGAVVVPAQPGADTPPSGTGDGSGGTGSGTGSEGTPNTGMATADWTGVAYLLIVMGGAAVTLARLRRPIATSPRRR